MSTVTVPRDNLVLQRFLALFLFAGSAVFAIATFVAAAQVVSGDMRAIGMLVGTGLPSWTLGWLGGVLWAGRGIPRWFIASFLLLVGLGPLVLAFFSDKGMESLTLAGAAALNAFSVLPTLRNVLGEPAKPKSSDEI